jgi:hypothetical protein
MVVLLCGNAVAWQTMVLGSRGVDMMERRTGHPKGLDSLYATGFGEARDFAESATKITISDRYGSDVRLRCVSRATL